MRLVMWIVWLLVGWFLWRGRRSRPARRFSERKHWALALGAPMAEAMGWRADFMSPTIHHVKEDGRGILRAPLLHQLEFRADATDEEARRHLAQVLESRWFRADLHALLPSDDPRAALAFACVRMAFLVRSAMLMQWTDDPAAWRVLLLNAQRAQECFASWEDFGRAFIQGRSQWVAAFRADPLGKTLEEQELRALLAPTQGAWSGLPWPGPEMLPHRPRIDR